MNLYGRKFENGFMGFDLEVFRLPDSQDVWFIGKDVADVMGYTDASATISKKVWSSSKFMTFVENIIVNDGTCQNGNSRNYHNNITLINEPGLYQLIFGSKMPKAEEFQKWVYEDVLPSIRKFGSYTAWTMGEDPDAIIERSEMGKYDALVKSQGEFMDTPDGGDYKYEEAKQLVKDCVNAIRIGDFAKVIASNTNIKIGRNRLYRWLREHNFFGQFNMPLQTCIEKDWFRTKQYMVRISKDKSITRVIPLITPKGEQVILDAIVREGILDYGEDVIDYQDGTIGVWDDQSQEIIRIERIELLPYLDATEVLDK